MIETILIIILAVLLATVSAIAWYYRGNWIEESDKKWNAISADFTEQKTLMKGIADRDITIAALRAERECYKSESKMYENLYKDAANNCDVAQDKLASMLCQHNSHVWIDDNGNKRCKKCGKVKMID